MISSIILAAGKGTRMQSTQVNKVVLPFHRKPLIKYGVELLQDITFPIVVVVGAFSQSVKDVLKDYQVEFVNQEEQLGTGHAVKIGLEALRSYSPVHVIVGYGDHMMFYQKETVRNLIDKHIKEESAITFITTVYDNPDELRWGRIVRDSEGKIKDSVEQKDATDEVRKIKELNAGFYCFDYQFLSQNIDLIPKSPVTNEYYINSLIKTAVEQNKKVIGLPVPFEEVGIGINDPKELEESQKLYGNK